MASAIDKLIEKLMLRLGFVKLASYGLMRTPEDRLLALRPVLDDGVGGRIVGWRDTDLASTELPMWGSLVTPSPMPSLAAPPSLPPTWRAATVPPPPPRAALTISPVAAPPPPPEEDWELVLARARAQPEDAVARPVARPLLVSVPVAAPSHAPAPKLAPLPPKVAPAAAESKTAPMRAARVMAAPERPIDSWNNDEATTAAPVRATVIPVPTLPRVTGSPAAQTSAYRPQPVVTSPLPAARRIARGTRPPTQDMPAVAANDDGTETHVQAAPSSDHTATQIQIAPAPKRAATVAPGKLGAIPSIKQRMAGR